jgi:hydroxyethylthiazole kinase-like uncharacterized protein yjeF
MSGAERRRQGRVRRRAQIVDADLLKTMPLPGFGEDADKADRGKLLVIAGSRRLPGAAILVARAALRTGCGTVRVAAPEGVAGPIGVALPELMVLPLPETPAGTVALGALETLAAQYEPCSAAVIGPGLDAHEETDELIRGVVRHAPLPLLVDAQALLAVAQRREESGQPSGGTGATPRAARIFTPHAAEMRALVGLEVPEEGKREAAREALALRWACERAAVLVLKGRQTLIASPGNASDADGCTNPEFDRQQTGALYRNTAGTRGLGTAGSGDTLAGMIGGLLAQGLEPAHAAIWGVYLHARAGEAAAKDLGEDGLLASDWVERLPKVLRTLRLRTAG